MADSPLLQAALAYAARGWPVFPCDPRQDRPQARRRRAKAPLVAGPDRDEAGRPIPQTGGLWRASTDAAQIRTWWRIHPAALIGVPMGRRSGAFAIDLDPRGESLADVERRLLEAVGPLPVGPRSMTQSGGLHLWFRMPASGEIPKNSAKRIAGVDWRGDGGYVIVPPSVMSDGKSYAWLIDSESTALPEATPKLLDLVFQRGEFGRGARGPDQPPPAAPMRIADPDDAGEKAVRRYAQGALDRARHDVATAAEGTRGHTLNATAFGLAPFVTLGALTEREVTAALQDAADACGLTSVDGARERDAKIRRGLQAGAGNTAELDRKLAEIRDEARRKADRLGGPAPPAGEGKGRGSRRAPADTAGGGGAAGGAPPSDGGDGAGDDDTPDPAVLQLCAGLAQNDTGNAWRLIHHFGRDMLNVREIGPHLWTGTHWEAEGAAEAFLRFAQRTAERICREPPFLAPTPREAEIIEAATPLFDRSDVELESDQKTLRAAGLAAKTRVAKRRDGRWKFGISSGNNSRLGAMIVQAAPHITVAPEELDADPLAINVRNGTLRLVRERVREEDPECPDPQAVRWITRTRWRVRLDPHRREDRITKTMPVDYHPQATCPRWQAFMVRFQPAEPVRQFLQAWHGYSLTGLMGEQAFVFNYGLGANGKTTFMETLARLMGSYAQVLPAEALTGDLQRRGDQATPEFARLPGARLVRCAELPRGQSFRESTLKMLTGGEALLVRHLHKQFFEFRPAFKSIGSGNDRPNIGGVDEGIWRRVKLVRWQVQIPRDQRRPMEEVLGEFAAEASGILNWLLAGLVDYLEGGLVVPEEVLSATESYRSDMDPVGEFLAACVEAAPGWDVTARELYTAYVAWSHANSVKPFSERNFAAIMVQKGVEKVSGRIRVYKNLRLCDVPADPEISAT